MSKTNFEVHLKHLKVYWRNDDKILPVFAQFLYSFEIYFLEFP